MIKIEEKFIKINGYNEYEISNYGRVRSIKTGQPKILTPWLDGKRRYYMICLCQDGKIKKCLIHRLVAENFIPNPSNKSEVNHKDHNTHNNFVDNLEWVTRKENMHHCFKKYPAARNIRKCILEFPDGQKIEFDSVCEMQRYHDIHNLPFGKYAINYYGHSCGYTLHKL